MLALLLADRTGGAQRFAREHLLAGGVGGHHRVLECEQRAEQGGAGSSLRTTAGRGVVAAAAGGEHERRGGATERLATRQGGRHRAQTSLHPVRISRAHWDELIAHAREDAPNECCGYLSAKDGVVEAVVARGEPAQVARTATSSTTRACLRRTSWTTRASRSGIYHSHPRSPAEPSQTDINLATYPHWRYLIISLEASRSCAFGGSPTAASRRRSSTSSMTDEPLACPECGRVDETGASFCPSCGMPLVRSGAEPLEAPLSEAHGRARKIDPAFTEGDLVRVAGGRNQAEAELIQGLLLEWGVPSILRRSAGFDVPDFLAAGPRDVLVPSAGAETAREVLLEADMAPTTGERRAPRPLLLAAVIALGGAATALVAWLAFQGA